MIDRPLIAVLDNKDQLLCVTDEYFGGNLHTFLQGTAAFFRCSVLQKSDLSQYFNEGYKLSFIYRGKSYHFDITDVVQNEDYVTVQADSLTLELRNEDASEYKAPKAMTFEEYLKVFLFTGDNPLVMGINEVSDKKLQLEWEGSEDDLLSRLFSLANKFSAEIEFETRLNQHWGLSEIVLNVYKAHDDKNQGIGNNRQDIILEWGNNVETIEIHKNIDNLKTAIKPVGTDGLTIVGIEIDERDELGNQLFYSPKSSPIIYAVQAKEQFISKVNGEGYIKKNWTYETKNQNTLAGQALTQLKKISQVELTVTIKSYEYLEIGDTVRALNTAYKPELNLSVRVSEQDIYFDQPSKNQTTFTNVEILKSEVDTLLLDRVQALIDANKVFTYEIITSDGVTFKNGQGSTTLTARVRDGIADVTNTFSLKWYKDGTLFSNTKTVTINAADIEEKAVFRFEVADDSGNVRGGAEVTVSNVADGKPSYMHTAYAWSADGKDRFTTTYPGENLFSLKVLNSITPESWVGSVSAYLYKFVLKPNTQYILSSNVPSSTTDTTVYLNGTSTTVNGVWAGKSVIQTTNSSGEIFLAIVTKRPYTEHVLSGEYWLKFEEGATSTIYTPSPQDDFENAYPKWEGSYSDNLETASDNPDDYAPWTPIRGEDGIAGKDGVGIASTKVEYVGSSSGTVKPTTGWTTTIPTVAEGSYLWTRMTWTYTDNTSEIGYSVAKMGPKGDKGDKGDSAPTISLSGATQAITVDKDGKITPASSFAVTGTAVNTTISNWTYSLNGGNFGSAVPTGVTRSGNTVTIDPTKAVFETFTIKAADATVSDVFTIARIKDGGEGIPGADAYTVFLTNESYTFAGSTTAAFAGSTTTEVIVYKGINKITPTSITVGTKPTGLSSSVSGSIITLTATTALVSKSGTVPITIIADGKTFTKQFAYALSLQGGKGDPGDPGKGVSAEEISYAISQDGVNPPTSGWSGTRPTPKAGWYMWTRTRFKYTDNTYSAYFYLVAQQGKDAIIISATPPINPAKEDLWQDPNDATSTVYKWDGTSWVRWGIAIDNLIASNVQIENGVFKRVEGTVIVGSKFVNSFSYADGDVTYTGSATIEDGNVIIARTGSDGSTWTTSLDRSLGFQDTYKASATAPARTTQLGQGKLYMAESGVGGYLPAAALNPASWTNLSYSSGFTTAENNPCQYRKVQLVDGSWELQLRGQIKPTSGDFSTTASPTGGVLPAGYRPVRNEIVTAADSTKKGARVVVLSDGQIQLNTPNGGNYVSFGGIRIAL